MATLTVEEASATYARAMRNVRRPGLGICTICKTFVDQKYERCLRCNGQRAELDAVLPITYSEHLGQVHLALRRYKDGGLAEQRYAAPRLNGILWRFLKAHEGCLARAVGSSGFEIVCAVPSSTPSRDNERDRLRRILQACGPVKERFERLLLPTGDVPEGRAYDQRRYEAGRSLAGEDVLLVDDTWAGGGHAQSAATALKAAGAGSVGLVVIGRHVQPDWRVGDDGETCAALLDQLPKVFDWDDCALHGDA